MQQPIKIGAALLALGLGGAGVANAQGIYVVPRPYHAVVPPGEVVQIVRAAGLTPLTGMERRGPNYLLSAVDRSGRPMRVFVNIYTGRIAAVYPDVAVRSYGPHVGGPYAPPRRMVTAPPADIEYPPGAVQRMDRYGAVAPVPPQNVPHARLANAPTAVPQTAQPAKTPVPRPRPSVAANDTTATPAAAAPAATTPAAEQTAPPAASTTGSPPKAEAPKLVPVAPLE